LDQGSIDAEVRRDHVEVVALQITVVIAERQRADRAACLRLLEAESGIRVVGEAKSGLEAITSTGQLRPRILLLDLALARAQRIPLIPALRQKSPQTKVILLTDGASETRTLEALAHGARGYLDKAVLTTFLPRAVRVVDAGEAWVSRQMVARIMDRLVGLTTWAGKTA
jgi:DNA-binding NarL/FixJ family response regulator